MRRGYFNKVNIDYVCYDIGWMRYSKGRTQLKRIARRKARRRLALETRELIQSAEGHLD